MEVMIGLAVVLMVGGFIAYNPLREKWADVIGVGGSYVILLGVMLLLMTIGSLVSLITGGTMEANPVEIVVSVIAMILCLAYTVHVMLTRCTTASQRILLPFVGCLIGFGFCWRLVASIVFHAPMATGGGADGKTEHELAHDISRLPGTIYNDEGRWSLVSSGSPMKYRSEKGREINIYNAEISGTTAQTNEGGFWWY